MTHLENVSRESLETALKEIRKDIVRLSGLIGIASGDSDFWLILATGIGLTHLIQVNLHMGFVVSMLLSAGIVYGLYLLRSWGMRKKVSGLMKDPLERDTDVDLS